ncbi:MAG: CoA ester lyase [Acidimicrobiia bacterium]|nr:CoA ester lyase [Acidimicrobiia bacterium]
MRSLLFAPATKPELVPKLAGRGADAVVFDLEDAVPAGAKVEARAQARHGAEQLLATAGPEVWVRVNAVPSEWFEADVAEALPTGLSGVVVPKVEDVAQVVDVVDALTRIGLTGCDLMAGIETAAGVLRAEVLLASPVTHAYFGAEDYISDLGGARSADNDEVLYARSRVALAARVGGVHALDQVVTDYGDDERFLADAAQGRRLGYRGKLCIHPAQVALTHQAFTPGADEVARARALLAAYEAAAADGQAAISFDGQMVDEPLARQARDVLARAEDT